MRAPISSSSSTAYANIAPGHPVLEVVFTARNERLGARLFRHGVKHRVVPIPLTGSVVDAQGRVVVDIEIENPVSPEDLGLGSDTRLLGLHLQWLMVRRTGVRGHWDTVRHRLQSRQSKTPRRQSGGTTGDVNWRACVRSPAACPTDLGLRRFGRGIHNARPTVR